MEDHVFFSGLWADEGGEVGGGCETLETGGAANSGTRSPRRHGRFFEPKVLNGITVQHFLPNLGIIL